MSISDYINFCSEIAAPPKQVKVFPNNKPWITANTKGIINKKKKAFGEGNTEALKLIQKELKCVIKREKTVYKNKIEAKFCQNNMKQVWQGMRLMSGYTNSGNKSSKLPNISIEYANELNSFYNRFDEKDFSNEINDIHTLLSSDLSTEPFLHVLENDVRKQFAKLNPTKAGGPDNMRFSYIFSYIFNLCISKYPSNPVDLDKFNRCSCR